MLFKIGDFVTRKSHNNDMVFKIMDLDDDIAILSGINMRLTADAPIDDLSICKGCADDYIKDDDTLLDRMSDIANLNRDEYFYLPGKILHIDTDTQLSNKASNPYKIRENTNFKKYKKSQKKQKISNFS